MKLLGLAILAAAAVAAWWWLAGDREPLSNLGRGVRYWSREWAA